MKINIIYKILLLYYFDRFSTMMKDYAVVTFTQDGNEEQEIVSEVPSVWLELKSLKCWWPSVKNINALIAKQALPDIDDPKWCLYPVEFHGYYGNLYFIVYLVCIL